MPKEATTELHSVKTMIALLKCSKQNLNTHVFKKFPEKERLVKLKEVFKIATSVSDIKVKDAKVVSNKNRIL
jgi:hypothetical protein